MEESCTWKLKEYFYLWLFFISSFLLRLCLAIYFSEDYFFNKDINKNKTWEYQSRLCWFCSLMFSKEAILRFEINMYSVSLKWFYCRWKKLISECLNLQSKRTGTVLFCSRFCAIQSFLILSWYKDRPLST